GDGKGVEMLGQLHFLAREGATRAEGDELLLDALGNEKPAFGPQRTLRRIAVVEDDGALGRRIKTSSFGGDGAAGVEVAFHEGMLGARLLRKGDVLAVLLGGDFAVERHRQLVADAAIDKRRLDEIDA